MTQSATPKYDRDVYDLSTLAPDHIDRLTLERVPRASRVLELGCATGYMSEYLKRELGCRVTGVELDPLAARQARKHTARVIVGDLDAPDIWSKIHETGSYDVVLAANIIEHLKDTRFQLDQIRQSLKSAGKLIIVVPNIAWWRSRLRLLQGTFAYERYGLFDETHLRFFSLPSLRDVLRASGFQILDEAYDPAGGAKWLTPLLKCFPNAYAYQVVMVAGVSGEKS